MNFKFLHCGGVALAIIALGLSIAYAIKVERNEALQAEVQQRQQLINGTQPLLQIYQGIVSNLATLAIEGKDEQVRALLTENGIQLPEAAKVPASAEPAKKK